MKSRVLAPVERLLRLASVVGRAVENTDGWVNILTGLNRQGKDSRTGAGIEWQPLGENGNEGLYASDDIARRVVDYPAREGTRKWIRFQLDADQDQRIKKAAEDEFERLEVRNRFRKAWGWARLYGGAGVFLAVDDGRRLDQPLELQAIRKVNALTVLHRYELDPYEIDGDLGSPNFGEPLLYQLSSRAQTVAGLTPVHYSRIIRFDGVPLPRTLHETNQHWGDSVLSQLWEVLRDYNLASGSAANAIQDFRVGILKIKNLADIVASDQDDVVLKRLNLLKTSKSIMQAFALDADSEDFILRETTMAGVKDVIQEVAARMVAATELPHTIILGTGATGTLSGGGQSEDRNAKDLVAGLQEDHLTKPIDRALEVVQAARLGPFRGRRSGNLSWQFVPLWQMSEKEKADLHEVQSRADRNYWEMGVLDSDQIQQSRFGSDEFSTETMVEPDEDSGEPPPGNAPSPAGAGSQPGGTAQE